MRRAAHEAKRAESAEARVAELEKQIAAAPHIPFLPGMMTPKQKVLRKYPGAAPCWWMKSCRNEIRTADFRVIGTGVTASEAWADAAKRLTKGK